MYYSYDDKKQIQGIDVKKFSLNQPQVSAPWSHFLKNLKTKRKLSLILSEWRYNCDLS